MVQVSEKFYDRRNGVFWGIASTGVPKSALTVKKLSVNSDTVRALKLKLKVSENVNGALIFVHWLVWNQRV